VRDGGIDVEHGSHRGTWRAAPSDGRWVRRRTGH
jgi:hypothetical protein